MFSPSPADGALDASPPARMQGSRGLRYSTGGGNLPGDGKRKHSPVPMNSADRSKKPRTTTREVLLTGGDGPAAGAFDEGWEGLLADVSPAAPPGRRSRTALLREGFDMDVARLNMMQPGPAASTPGRGDGEGSRAGRLSWAEDSFQSHAADVFFPDRSTREAVTTGRVLRHFESPPPLGAAPARQMAATFSRTAPARGGARFTRSLPQMAERVLDAPHIRTDPCMRLISMNRDHGVLAVGLSDTVYTWNAATNATGLFFSHGDVQDPVCSLAWQQGTAMCASGASTVGLIRVWDAERRCRVRRMDGHYARVCALEWNNHVLTSGSADGQIIHHDTRVKDHAVARLRAHGTEICTLSYSYDGCTLASSDVDGTVMIWDAAANVRRPKTRFEAHQGPVTALSWAPGARHKLLSGGGADRSVRLWGTVQGEQLSETPTGSEVSDFLWSDNGQELLTCHGEPGNHMILWRYRAPHGRFTQLGTIKGHMQRIQNVCMIDGEYVVTCSVDETIRFWRVFDRPRRRGSPTEVCLR
eukprot:TRINITY_DN15970_c0_g2_i1.p1 TRINITY_DN15970_c0_g2~~TRINITY_DN15970_c0_g2_i1.p1  ORF type:complete len:529 (+),score=146.34 TRINITY_DN15970_c0_g2_i1:108-1694(+)